VVCAGKLDLALARHRFPVLQCRVEAEGADGGERGFISRNIGGSQHLRIRRLAIDPDAEPEGDGSLLSAGSAPRRTRIRASRCRLTSGGRRLESHLRNRPGRADQPEVHFNGGANVHRRIESRSNRSCVPLRRSTLRGQCWRSGYSRGLVRKRDSRRCRKLSGSNFTTLQVLFFGEYVQTLAPSETVRTSFSPRRAE
jgi:hypothetical protein